MKSVTLDDFEINKFKNTTRHLKHEKPHQYEDIRINDDGVIFILYKSGKLVHNTNSKTLDLLSLIVNKERHLCNNIKKPMDKTNQLLENYNYTIGSDETGKGEWYGPLVVCAVCTSKDQNKQLKDIGVADSKKFNHAQIFDMYHEIEKLKIPHHLAALKPYSYNKLYYKFKHEGKNLNHLLAYLHSKCINAVLKDKPQGKTLVIIDKFDEDKMNQYLNLSPQINVIQQTGAERYIPVATSSIIAKYHYEKILNQLEKRYNINLSKKTKPSKIDKDIMDKVAKTHFKNIQREL